MTQSEVNPTLTESVTSAGWFGVEQMALQIHQWADLVIKVAIVGAIVNLLVIIGVCTFASALAAGKLVVVEVMLGISAVCLAIFWYRKLILSHLTDAEEIAYVVRDQAFVDLNMARQELRRMRHKLRRDTDDEGYGHVNELLKMVSPLVMMFIQKEKNILRWGMFGWKVAQNAMAVIKQRSKEES
ncbi:MAG: hypothetical protein JST89_14970 [Cyanobacteria bacterium SZAS-4]|nr:hypothetical protein [Cyanobacteria bacterium SZAS-4]